jgi:hypothetical protein
VKTSINIPGLYFRAVMSLIYPAIFYVLFISLRATISGCKKVPLPKGTYTVSGLFIVVYMQPNLFEIIIGIVKVRLNNNIDFVQKYIGKRLRYQRYKL